MKSKRKIVLKKKPQTQISSGRLNKFHAYVSTTRACSPIELPRVVKTMYQEVFDTPAPVQQWGVEFCRHRVGYFLYREGLKEAGEKVPESVEKNYHAFMAFNIEKMTNGVIKHLILAELSKKTEQGEDSMAREKEKKVSPKEEKKASSEKVYQTWIRLFEENATKNLSDEKLAAAMCTAHPGKKPYTVGDVARHRSLYNNGKIKSQTKAPKVKVEQVGKAEKVAKEKPSKPAKVKKVEAPVVKKKVTLKKKVNK